MCSSYSLYRCSELLGLGHRRDMNMILSALEESNPQPKLENYSFKYGLIAKLLLKQRLS